jgi:riboflavin synthase
MFTGIVIEQGTVVETPPRLVLSAPLVSSDAGIGDSVAVDGCCLTVTSIDGDRLSFDAVPETLRRSTLGSLEAGATVNLEPALRVGDRMGGHWVQGHVDGVGRVEEAVPDGEAVNLTFSAPASVLRYTIEKGSICVNGVSLTVTAFTDSTFSVSIVPHTREVSNIGRLEPGSVVNVEADLFGKYVERMRAETPVVPSNPR